MTTFRFTLIGLAMLGLMTPSKAHADSMHTWVSGVGNDANPCSRTLPCKTFAGAIGKTTAGGIIDALDAGSFGAVTIRKSITLGGCCGAGILVSGNNNAITIDAVGAVVNLRRLDIQGIGGGVIGVSILNASSVVIEDCVIYGFGARGISDTRSATGSLSIRNTMIKQNGLNGVLIFPTGAAAVNAMIDNCAFQGNGNAGLAIETGVNLMVFRSISTANATNGFYAGPGSRMNLQSCVASNNAAGIAASAGGTMRVSDTQITSNALGLSPGGGQLLSYGNNNLSDNNVPGAFTGSPLMQQ